VAGAVASALSTEPPPPPREKWTFGLLESCGAEPQFCLWGCCCPCLATAEVQAYRETGSQERPPSECSVCFHLFVCFLCQDGLMQHEREKVRKKTNMVENCNDDCVATMCCHGCAVAQMKRELAVYYGHAPVHPGTPAAKKMQR
jgi:Cys-rich protein (TIGR01571 family)